MIIIKAKLTNPKSPDAAPVDVSFPITEYEDIYRTLAGAGIGGPVEQDCRVAEISGPFEVLSALRGQDVNVDELDYLAKRLESFFEPEAQQFEGTAAARGISSIEDFINLTFCCQRATVITDFSDLRAIGRDHYLNKNGGCAPVSEMEALDAEKEARDLIQNENGTVTPYGVVYENGMELEQLYKGREFPAYLYDHCVMAAKAKSKTEPDAGSTWLYLPMPEVCADRALIRGCLSEPGDISLDYEVVSLSSDVFRWIDPATETPESLNEMAGAIAGLDKGDTEKLCAIAEYAEPGSAKALRNLAQNTGLFDYYPDTSTPEEYGRKVIAESGYFKYDAELDGFYDFEKYGKWRMEQEAGEYIGGGYLCYRGFVSIEEVMAGVSSERMDIAEAPGMGMTMGGM